MEVVRNNFLEVMAQKSESVTGVGTRADLISDDLSDGYHLTTEDSQRLRNIEQALQEQRQLLETIASQSHQVLQLVSLINFLPLLHLNSSESQRDISSRH
ncbi:unnamed protein product [Brugia timori]|uniref:t-SNARE coiled-coil homology domain-containing protein n=1 Tax=Brugia timori TaxID=42155 RepID=A0A0R3R5X0_9BILA|nr:unnamed protein product [Brugia timori]